MEPLRKRSATQANLPSTAGPLKRRQTPRQPSAGPLKPFTFDLLPPNFQLRITELAGSAYASMSKAFDYSTVSGQSSGEREDTPDTDVPGSFPVAPKPTNQRDESGEEAEEDDHVTEEEVLSDDNPRLQESPGGGSPVPATPMSRLESTSPLRDAYTYDSTYTSNRSTPLSTNSPRKGGTHKLLLKPGFRYRAHPLQKQHELEQRMRQMKELHMIRRRFGYTQDLSTFRGFLSYREQVEAYIVASDKRFPPPTTRGPESIPAFPSSNYLHRAVVNARKTLDSPRPFIPSFTESDIIARRNKARDEEIERRLRPPLPDSLQEEDEEAVQKSFANRAFVAKVAREQVAHADLCRLRPHQWLNDEIINFYGAMISERAAKFEEEAAKAEKEGPKDPAPGMKGTGSKRTYPPPPGMEGIGDPWKVHVFNTYFLSKLTDLGYEKSKLNKWTKKVDIFSKELLLIPCNLGNSHWTTAAINFKNKRIEYYDSMGMDRPTIRAALRTYLDKEHRDKKGGVPFDFEGWTDYFAQDGPQQENGYDCGVFVCQTMENLSRGVPVPFDFTQQHMQYLRRRMVLEIAAERLPLGRL